MAKKKSDKAGDGKTTVAPPAIKAMKAMKAMKTVEIEDTLTLTCKELADGISESMFSCLAGTRDARPWAQCDYEGDFIAMTMFFNKNYKK